jgi:DNA-binding GntR family transcriptional regulator
MSAENTSPFEPVPPDVGLRPLVVRRLIRAMFNQRLLAGDRLVVGKLAMQLGASSTPVREALLELSTLGLVELLPNRGAVCLEFGAEQLRDMYLARRVLEVEATRRAAANLARAAAARTALREIRDRLAALFDADDSAPGWLDEAVAVDVALHQAVAANCSSPRLCHEINRYEELMVCVREFVGNDRAVQQVATEEHIALVDHLLASRTDEAANAMRYHLEHTAELAAAMLFPEHSGARSGVGPADVALAERMVHPFLGTEPSDAWVNPDAETSGTTHPTSEQAGTRSGVAPADRLTPADKAG